MNYPKWKGIQIRDQRESREGHPTRHPNRSRRSSTSNPKPDEIARAREAAGLTQTEAAALVFTTCRVWQQWEAGDRRMHPAFWQLFTFKTSSGPPAR